MELTWSGEVGAARGLSSRARLGGMFDAHADSVWRVLRRCGLDRTLADDGLQEVFVIAQQRLADIVPRSEHAFLCSVAVRVAARLKLSARSEEPIDAVPELTAAGPGADELLALRRRRQLLDRVLGRLDHQLRTVLVLAELEGLSKGEVAAALQIPEGTAASRLRRAREAFARELEQVASTRLTRPRGACKIL